MYDRGCLYGGACAQTNHLRAATVALSNLKPLHSYMAETDSAYKGITAATVSLASSSRSYNVWSVHSSEAHYSSAQRPEWREVYPLQH